jgi:hypothetical protein
VASAATSIAAAASSALNASHPRRFLRVLVLHKFQLHFVLTTPLFFVKHFAKIDVVLKIVLKIDVVLKIVLKIDVVLSIWEEI